MNTRNLLLALSVAPTIALAQTSASVQASASTKTSADVPSTYSADNQARIEATFVAARQHNLPERPIRDRIAEGHAKGAAEASVVLAAQRTETRMEATQSAMVRAGRSNPSSDEIVAGQEAMSRGATDAQIEAVVSHSHGDRSMAVALNTLATLQAQGVSADRAVARIVSNLDARASDQAIAGLAVTSNAQANGALAAPGTQTTAATSAAGAVTGAGSSVTAGLGATVGAVVKKPPM